MLSVLFESTLCCLCSSKTRYVVGAVQKHVMLSVHFENTLCCLLRLSKWRTHCPAWNERSTVSETLQEGKSTLITERFDVTLIHHRTTSHSKCACAIQVLPEIYLLLKVAFAVNFGKWRRKDDKKNKTVKREIREKYRTQKVRNQCTKDLLSTRKTSHKYNNKDLGRLR